MRILLINNYHYIRGGSDKYFLELARLLHKHGHEVYTLSTFHNDNIYTNLYAHQPLRLINTTKPEYITDYVRFLYSFEARKAVKQIIKYRRPDIVHLHIYYGQITASILRPLVHFNIPIVQTLHEYKLVCPTHALRSNGKFCDACQGRLYWQAIINRCNRNSIIRSMLSALESYVSDALGARKKINHFIAVSKYQRDQLIRLGLDSSKISVIYNYTDFASQPPDALGHYLLYVGRLSEEKGLDLLLRAYAKIAPPRIPLKIVGHGDNINYWKRRARDLGVSYSIHWLGHLTGSDLQNIYRHCLVLVNPSLLNETFGLTNLEALSQGRPVIASNVGAFREIIEHNVNGWIVPVGSVDALASTLQYVITNPQIAFKMGINGWRHAHKKYNSDKHYSEIMSIYERLINNQ
ncbi:MAG: glycosyltransferase family 4 protein [Methylacidiphilales bacterium]|nr:glycosyltransferase family 4 protein [Candidatus Methylacidiphilales bacterium]